MAIKVAMMFTFKTLIIMVCALLGAPFASCAEGKSLHEARARQGHPPLFVFFGDQCISHMTNDLRDYFYDIFQDIEQPVVRYISLDSCTLRQTWPSNLTSSVTGSLHRANEESLISCLKKVLGKHRSGLIFSSCSVTNSSLHELAEVIWGHHHPIHLLSADENTLMQLIPSVKSTGGQAYNLRAGWHRTGALTTKLNLGRIPIFAPFVKYGSHGRIRTSPEIVRTEFPVPSKNSVDLEAHQRAQVICEREEKNQAFLRRSATCSSLGRQNSENMETVPLEPCTWAWSVHPDLKCALIISEIPDTTFTPKFDLTLGNNIMKVSVTFHLGNEKLHPDEAHVIVQENNNEKVMDLEVKGEAYEGTHKYQQGTLLSFFLRINSADPRLRREWFLGSYSVPVLEQSDITLDEYKGTPYSGYNGNSSSSSEILSEIKTTQPPESTTRNKATRPVGNTSDVPPLVHENVDLLFVCVVLIFILVCVVVIALVNLPV